MSEAITHRAGDAVHRARTHNGWLDKPVSDARCAKSTT
jgi:hypothetical protein